MRLLTASDGNFAAELAAFCRGAQAPAKISRAVASILAGVRRRGDAAVADYAARFDGAGLRPREFRVAREKLRAALAGLPAAEVRALRAAHDRIAEFNRRGRPRDWRSRNADGALTGEKFDPIRRVGLYIPGGEAPLVSTVLMTATLARLAGCPEIAAFTPAKAGGLVAPPLLAALHLAGVEEVYRVGGVQAIGAMAFGTAAIPAVDKIFGPGNAYVCEAKRQVFGLVGIDSLPGPSEVMIIADRSARPDFAAADLLAQAEHGSGRERIFLVATSRSVMAAVASEIDRQVGSLPRRKQIRRVLADGFLGVIVDGISQAAEVANAAAPEHLELMVGPAAVSSLLRRITTAGAIMVGNDTPTALGDFVAGPSHVLPTGRTGRFSSGLRLADFFRRTSVIRFNRTSLGRAAPVVAAFAAMERLGAHGRSVEMRLEGGPSRARKSRATA